MGKSPERFERSCSSLSTPPPQPPFRAGARRRYLAQPTLPVSSVGSREALSHTSCWLILRPLSLALGAKGAPARGEAHRAGGWECGRAAIRRDQVYSPRRVQTASAHGLSCVPRGSLCLLLLGLISAFRRARIPCARGAGVRSTNVVRLAPVPKRERDRARRHRLRLASGCPMVSPWRRVAVSPTRGQGVSSEAEAGRCAQFLLAHFVSTCRGNKTAKRRSNDPCYRCYRTERIGGDPGVRPSRRAGESAKRQVEGTFTGDRGYFPEVNLHELARAQVCPGQPRVHEVSLDLGVHPVEAEGVSRAAPRPENLTMCLTSARLAASMNERCVSASWPSALEIISTRSTPSSAARVSAPRSPCAR
jgi:hypothetical protein